MCLNIGWYGSFMISQRSCDNCDTVLHANFLLTSLSLLGSLVVYVNYHTASYGGIIYFERIELAMDELESFSRFQPNTGLAVALIIADLSS